MRKKFQIKRKGAYFTIIAILLVTALLITIKAETTYTYKDEMMLIEKRVNTINNFLIDINDDLGRSLYIASFRGLLGITEYMTQTKHNYVNDVESSFVEIIINGTVENQSLSIMENSTLTDWAQRVINIGNEIGVNISFPGYDVEIEQQNPWNLTITTTVMVHAKDYKSVAEWNKNITTAITISIIEFEDPVYAVESNGRLFNRIVPTPYRTFVDGDNTTDLTAHIEEGYYVASTSAPGYLNRLEGNLNASPYGIESILKSNDLVFHSMETNRSHIDHIYWGTPNATWYNINHTTTHLDNQSGKLAFYGCEHLAYK